MESKNALSQSHAIISWYYVYKIATFMEAINNVNKLVIRPSRYRLYLFTYALQPSRLVLNYFSLSHQAQGNLHRPWYYNLIRETCCRKLGHLSPNFSTFGYWNIKTKSPNLDRNFKNLTWSICGQIQYKISKKASVKRWVTSIFEVSLESFMKSH